MDKIANEIQERWLDVKGFEKLYQISDQGQVKSLGRYVTHGNTTFYQEEHNMSQWCGTTSFYNCVRLYKNGSQKKYSVHRLVAQHFLPNWNPKLEVNHIDGNIDNNAVSNLQMCTRQENVRHAIMHFLKNDYGERSSNSKLKNLQAQEIRRKYQAGQTTQAILAKQYGVSPQTISAIVRYKKYIR